MLDVQKCIYLLVTGFVLLYVGIVLRYGPNPLFQYSSSIETGEGEAVRLVITAWRR